MTYAKRVRVREKYDGRCAYCGHKPVRFNLHVDHLVPTIKGGDDSLDNLMPCCPQCNNFKGGKTLEEFRAKLMRQVARARANSRDFVIAERYKLIKTVPTNYVEFYFERNPANDMLN